MVKPALSRHWKFFTASVALWAIELEEPVPAPELMSLAALTLTSDPAACEVFLRATVDAQGPSGSLPASRGHPRPGQDSFGLAASFEKMLQTAHFGT